MTVSVAQTDSDYYPALTIRQPWAWAIMAGLKRYENRTWKTRKLGPMIVHAAAGRAGVAGDVLWLREHGIDCPDANALDYGCIVGLVRVAGCLDVGEVESDLFREGPVCWVLEGPQKLSRPVMYRGQQGVFRVPKALVADQLR